MTRKSKEEVLKQLNEDENYKSILQLSKDDTERAAIAAYTESFVAAMYQNLLGPLGKALESDPNAVNKALLELQESLIKGSGSKSD